MRCLQKQLFEIEQIYLHRNMSLRSQDLTVFKLAYSVNCIFLLMSINQYVNTVINRKSLSLHKIRKVGITHK